MLPPRHARVNGVWDGGLQTALSSGDSHGALSCSATPTETSSQAWEDVSLGKVTCCLAWGPEFDAWDPHSGRREMTLTSETTQGHVRSPSPTLN